MAEVASKVKINLDVSVALVMNEAEIRALDGIFGYDVEQFLKVFYERMGRAYVEPHEAGVRSLHKTIRAILATPLRTVDDARRRLNHR